MKKARDGHHNCQAIGVLTLGDIGFKYVSCSNGGIWTTAIGGVVFFYLLELSPLWQRPTHGKYYIAVLTALLDSLDAFDVSPQSGRVVHR